MRLSPASGADLTERLPSADYDSPVMTHVLLPAVAALTGALVVAAVVSTFLWPTAAASLTEILRIVVGPALLLAFGASFRSQIAGLIERLSELSLLGGSLRANQQTGGPEPPPAAIEKAAAEVLTATDSPIIGAAGAAEPKVYALEQKLRQLQRAVSFWYSGYLRVFLQPVTREALGWMAAATADKPVPYDDLVAFLRSKGVNDAYHTNIWSALQYYNLVEAHGVMVNITRAGRIFLMYLDGTWRPLEQDAPTVN